MNAEWTFSQQNRTLRAFFSRKFPYKVQWNQRVPQFLTLFHLAFRSADIIFSWRFRTSFDQFFKFLIRLSWEIASTSATTNEVTTHADEIATPLLLNPFLLHFLRRHTCVEGKICFENIRMTQETISASWQKKKPRFDTMMNTIFVPLLLLVLLHAWIAQKTENLCK